MSKHEGVKRTKNYTEVEKEDLLRLIEKYTSIINNKKTDNSTVNEKKNAWASVAQEYNVNASNGVRTAEQLRMCYNNLKRITKRGITDDRKSKSLEAKKNQAEDKIEQEKKGGGCCNPNLAEHEAEILSSIKVEPLNNIYDDYSKGDCIVPDENPHFNTFPCKTESAVATPHSSPTVQPQTNVRQHKTNRRKISIRKPKTQLGLSDIRRRYYLKRLQATNLQVIYFRKQLAYLDRKNAYLDRKNDYLDRKNAYLDQK